jgi:hypothetical protein
MQSGQYRIINAPEGERTVTQPRSSAPFIRPHSQHAMTATVGARGRRRMMQMGQVPLRVLRAEDPLSVRHRQRLDP